MLLAENIMPIEVENAIKCYPGVSQCTVVGVPNLLWGQEVFAWVILNDGYERGSFVASEIIRHTGRHLADYKVPTYVEFTETIEMAPSGKILKAAMQKRAISLIEEREAAKTSPPKSVLHPSKRPVGLQKSEQALYFKQTVCSILNNELDLHIQDDDDSLMAEGLNSRGAVMLRNALSDRFGMELPGTVVFDYPSVSSISGFVFHYWLHQHTSLVEQDYAPEFLAKRAKGIAPSLRDLSRSVSIASSISCRTPRAFEGDSEEGSPMGRDTVRTLPCARSDGQDLQIVYSVDAVQFGAVLKDVDVFDAKRFGISANEATSIDPQQRMLLEGTHETLGADFRRSSGASCDVHRGDKTLVQRGFRTQTSVYVLI